VKKSPCLPDSSTSSMISFKNQLFISFLICFLAACGDKKPDTIQRPRDPWAFRSVLDRQPRMLTLALDSACYVAYDLARCTLYKAWKGGVTMEGTVYTARKNVQPTSWGTAYQSDSLQQLAWTVASEGRAIPSHIEHKGYTFKGDQIYLQYALILSSGDTIQVEERPEFVQSEAGKPGLERVFSTSAVPEGISVSLQFPGTTFPLQSNKSTRLVTYFAPLPAQYPPQPQAGMDHQGKYWMEKSDCLTCHEVDKAMVGPSFRQIAGRYRQEKEAVPHLVRKVKEGGSGVWGSTRMNPHPKLGEDDIKTMLAYILSLKPSEEVEAKLVREDKKERKEEETESKKTLKPGFGAALAGVHPSYNLRTIHPPDFKPRVGGLAFLPDGRLLVTTWDAVGGVYLLDGVETGEAEKVRVKQIASGLAEPLGIEVVDGEIFVLQKHELTHLIDHDGDEVIDEYRSVCNSWGVTDDFHEFAFGLVYQDGFFYATLSMAMRLMADEKQKPDRGRTLKISRDGRYEWVNYGLRTPNGIGLGVDGELFVTDNQGQWLPANKLIHVKKGEYHGMAWGIADSLAEPPSMTLPAIWLPQDEIGNSPSEPVLVRDGPYAGQMLHGDVTHGGIKRDFLEKINGKYQGAVFRFTQGLEAGVNRLQWGPDGALYVGGVGMEGGWGWKEKQYGLQKMKYNGKKTFEMLAVRAKPNGFEIEFTEALEKGKVLQASDFFLQQWRYLPTEKYGGPKMDLEELKVARIDLSKDRTRVFLEIPGLKKEHVVYFRLAEDLQSASGQSLWSSEAWYTLNNIPN
jgi:cytochrome c